jgi:serine/threonine protein kinase
MARPADEPILKEGQNFCGYVVIKELGRGGFGAVYLAEDHKFDRKVALKILLSDRSKDPKVRARFEREALAATRIDHPAIVQMLDKGSAPDGTLYLVMEFIEGEPLNKYIKTARERGVQIEPRVVFSVALQMARALLLAHSKGIFHRDLKPQNVILVPDETVVGHVRVKILDFGIAKLLPKLLGEDEDVGPTSTGEMQPGTYAYMPPEQYRAYRGITGLEEFLDVYALGVMLYQMLASRLPLQQSQDPASHGSHRHLELRPA